MSMLMATISGALQTLVSISGVEAIRIGHAMAAHMRTRCTSSFITHAAVPATNNTTSFTAHAAVPATKSTAAATTATTGLRAQRKT